MEREQRPERYAVNINGERIYLDERPCAPYLHSQEPWFDHIFVDMTEDNSPRMGAFLWRLKCKNFDDMVLHVINNGNEPILNDTASKHDRRMFKKHGLKVPEQIKEPEYKELTQRQENLGLFMAYLLINEHLTAEDFKGDGELYI